MPLEVTYLDDTVLEINTTGGHSIQVLTPDNRVEGAFALNDVKSVALISDTPPPVVVAPVAEVAPDPTPPPTEDPSGGELTDADAPDTISSPDDANSETDATAIESLTTQPDSEQEAAAPVDPETVDDVDPHTVAVVSAITSLDGAIAVAGDVSNDETTVAAHVAQAQTDIAELLTQYPDSLPLQDAKSQIDALAENFVPPAAA